MNVKSKTHKIFQERSLIRLRDQAGLSESHNLDLTFSVLFNLASQYDNNEMYTEALNTYAVSVGEIFSPQLYDHVYNSLFAGDYQEQNVQQCGQVKSQYGQYPF